MKVFDRSVSSSLQATLHRLTELGANRDLFNICFDDKIDYLKYSMSGGEGKTHASTSYRLVYRAAAAQ
jgi:hypothetical protein